MRKGCKASGQFWRGEEVYVSRGVGAKVCLVLEVSPSVQEGPVEIPVDQTGIIILLGSGEGSGFWIRY